MQLIHLILILPVVTNAILEVDIAAIGCFSRPPFLASLDWNVAPMQMAVEDVNIRFNGSVHYNLDFVYDITHTANWRQYLDDAEDVAAKWYYRKRRAENVSLSVVVSPGT